jgi:hypothetical protein
MAQFGRFLPEFLYAAKQTWKIRDHCLVTLLRVFSLAMAKEKTVKRVSVSVSDPDPKAAGS